MTTPSNPKETDQRLKSWLDTNQLDRERMCQAVLSLDRKFNDVGLRHPHGGPDGGRDIEARYQDGRPAWGAVGFLVGANDSKEQKRATKKKFKADLVRALREKPSLLVFVFFTNVRLTSGEKDELLAIAKTNKIEICEIYDRERIRIVLDSADGLGIRLQYLQLLMSDAEQAAFFSRWGSQIEGLLGESFRAVERRLERLEFGFDRSRPLRTLGFTLGLKTGFERDTIGHFRAVLDVGGPQIHPSYATLLVGTCDDNGRYDPPHRPTAPCAARAFWSLQPTKLIGKGQSSLPDSISRISGYSGFSEWGTEPQVSLGELDERFWAIFVNQRLGDQVAGVRILANEYLLYGADRSELDVVLHDHVPEWPWEFSKEELSDPWVRIMPAGYTGRFDFNSYTPKRVWAPTPVVDRESDARPRTNVDGSARNVETLRSTRATPRKRTGKSARKL